MFALRGFGGFCDCSAVNRCRLWLSWLLFFGCAVLSWCRPPCGGLSLAVWLVPLLSVCCLSVRPFGCRGGCGAVKMWGLVAVVCFSVVAVACRCRFEPFFCRSLPFSVVGWCLCLSVAFRGNLGRLTALFGGCPCFWLVGVSPVPIFGECMGGRITPLKFPKKIFTYMGYARRQGFPWEIIIYRWG